MMTMVAGFGKISRQSRRLRLGARWRGVATHCSECQAASGGRGCGWVALGSKAQAQRAEQVDVPDFVAVDVAELEAGAVELAAQTGEPGPAAAREFDVGMQGAEQGPGGAAEPLELVRPAKLVQFVEVEAGGAQ